MVGSFKSDSGEGEAQRQGRIMMRGVRTVPKNLMTHALQVDGDLKAWSINNIPPKSPKV